jgi:predicted MFS family arabinose efflux permease
VSSPENRAKNFGLIGAAFGIGFILGPVLGGWLAHLGGAATPFFVSGMLGVFNLIFLYYMLPETHHNRKEAAHFHIFRGLQNIKEAFNDKDASPVYWASFLYMSGFAFLTTFSGILTVQKYGFSEGLLGTYFGAVGAWVVVTQLFILPFVVKKFSERKVLRVTLALLALSVAIFPFMPNTVSQFLLVPFIAIPQGLSIATIGALISKSVSREKQGAALGINGSLIALSQAMIPLLAGVASGIVGITAPFMVGAFLILAAWTILVVSNKKREKAA